MQRDDQSMSVGHRDLVFGQHVANPAFDRIAGGRVETVRLEADEINYDQSFDEYSASGNVLIYKGNIKLLADFVRFDHHNMKAYAEGHVLLTSGEDILSGTSMEIDPQNQIGSVENGYLLLPAAMSGFSKH